MRIPIDPEFRQRAEREGLPMFRIQIDWRFVPKGKRSLKSHESCGYTTLEGAAALLRMSWSELQKAVVTCDADGAK